MYTLYIVAFVYAISDYATLTVEFDNYTSALYHHVHAFDHDLTDTYVITSKLFTPKNTYVTARLNNGDLMNTIHPVPGWARK